jgi:hypothetical protein
MYCKKIEQAGDGVYGRLVELAFIRGIDVYEIECTEPVRGIYHNYIDEGMNAKVIMVSRGKGKEYILARMLSFYALHKSVKAFVLSDTNPVTLLSEKADIMALRLYVRVACGLKLNNRRNLYLLRNEVSHG